MSVRQPRANHESSRQVTFRVEVSAEHAPAEQTFIDRARRAVLDDDETDVSVRPVRD